MIRSIMIAAAIAGMIGTARARCNDATIRGDYTFTVHGQLLSADRTTGTGLIDGVGIATFDGQGNFVQQDFVVRNGIELPGGPQNASGFHGDEGGTYTVNQDCTGTINLVLSPGNERTTAIVVSKSARSIHDIVGAALVNGNPGLTQVYADFEKSDGRD